MKEISLFDTQEEKELISYQPNSTLIALDIATVTGWRTKHASGVWDLTPKKDESKGMRIIKFAAKVRQMIHDVSPNLIVFEAAVNYSSFPNFVGVELIGVLKFICEENKIQYKTYTPTEIKKFATGKGNCNKEAMIYAAMKKHPDIDVIDNNHADAIHLYDLAMHDLFKGL